MVLWSVTLRIGALTKLGLFFPVVCFIPVFDQTLAEQLHCDKRLLSALPEGSRPQQPNITNNSLLCLFHSYSVVKFCHFVILF